ELRFLFVADPFYFGRQRFPAAPAIAWITSEKPDPGAPKQIGIERKQTDHKTEQNSRCRENSDAVLFDPLVPIMDREQSKTEERNGVPVRSRDVIEREQKVKREDRQTEPKEKKDFE